MSEQKRYIDCDTVINTDGACVILPSGNETAYKAAGLLPSDRIISDTVQRLGAWQDQDKKPTVSFRPSDTDISRYNALVIHVYSERATGAGLTLCIYCQQNETSGKTAYKRYTSYIDWTGWKSLIIPIPEMSDAYCADLSQVTRITWNAGGWGNTPDPETSLYIDTVYFAKKEYRLNIGDQGPDDSDYSHITDTLADLIVGKSSVTDAASPEIGAQLEKYLQQADEAIATVNSSGVWDRDMSTTAGITAQYGTIYKLARAYCIRSGKFYRDPSLLAVIKRAMEHMHINYYRDRANGSYPSRNNWWDWEIGSAQFIVNILMLCKDGFTQDETDRYLEPVNRYVPLPSMTMANLVDMAYVTVSAAALQKDALRIVLSRNKLDECMGNVMKGDGFYSDGSFIQHTVIPYTGSYGPIMLEALSKLVLALDGTCFRVKPELIDEQYRWTVGSFIPCMYHGVFFGNVRGRSLHRHPKFFSPETTAMQGMLRMTEYVSEDKARLIKGVIKEYAEYNDGFYTSMLEPFDADLYQKIKNDPKTAARTDYETVINFAMMDRPISVSRDHAVTVSLSSSRTAKYEGMNEENGSGWYTGDGMTYIYTDINDYSHEYWNAVNSYRLPGTTVTNAPRVTENINSNDTLSKYDFVGGASLGNAMAVAMQFESSTDKMRCTKYSTPFSSTLQGKKSWFIFENEVVCLGADISCSDDFDTETVIDNRRLDKNEKLYANGSEITESTGVLSNCTSLWYPSLGGVYIPEATDVSFDRSAFIELYLNHGKNIIDGSYAYVMLPAIPKDRSDAYCVSPDVEIIANTPKVQAVRKISTDTEGYIFWEAGGYGKITVSDPCILLADQTNITVSDPTMKLTTLTVTVNGQQFSCHPADGRTYTFKLG